MAAAARKFLTMMIKPFLGALDEHLDRFLYGRHSIEEWRTRYCFPQTRSANVQLRELYFRGESLSGARQRVINLDPDTVSAWVNRHLIAAEPVNGVHPYHIIDGGIGCGKSTINKYITTVHFSDFKSQRVIPSRIECGKLLKKLGISKANRVPPSTLTNAEIGTIFRLFVKRAMVRDVVQSDYTELAEAADGRHRLIARAQTEGWPDLQSREFRDFVSSSLSRTGTTQKPPTQDEPASHPFCGE